MISKEKQYALMFDGTEHDGILTGTAEEVARKYLEVDGAELKVDVGEDGYLGYFLSYNPDDAEDWDLMDSLDDQGSEEANLKAAYEGYFMDFLLDVEDNGYLAFEMDTPEKEALARWTHDELLDHISFREARDAGLDYDEEADAETRIWYYENKCQNPKAKRKAA